VQRSPAIHASEITQPDEPDENTRAEMGLYDAEDKRLTLDNKKIENEIRKQDMDERKAYSNKIYCLIASWLIYVGLIIFLEALGSKCGWFKLSDPVMIALITTSTASVIGLFAIVVNYLFKKK
jgi:hypothetical protein